MSTILIVDDDAQLRKSFARLLTDEGYEVNTAATGEEGLSAVQKDAFDLVIMDVRMPGMSGLEAFERMHDIDSRLPVIIMTAFAATDTAIKATQMGAFDYVLKPFDIPDILSLIEKAIDAGRLVRSRVSMASKPEENVADALIGRSAPMQEVYKAIGRVASTDATVLVRGESGTGKELVARAIFQHSMRASKPFLIINCVAIPETLLESELFGYEKGAFTGAVSRRLGKIEQADGGTVFLDEIGDMPLSIQAKILRLLQEKSIERLGGHDSIPLNVRIIAATNRDLEQALKEGRFREDLYYRLKVVSINLPPLRDRRDDIPQLCEYFLGRYSAEMGIDNPGAPSETLDVLQTQDWPGNVRELANTLKKALIFSRGYPIRPEDILQVVQKQGQGDEGFMDEVENNIRQWVRETLSADDAEDIFSELSNKFSGIVISEALSMTGGNRTKAARLLGLSRPTLQSKIDKYNLTIETSVKSE